VSRKTQKKVTLAFVLSMPGRSSWDDRWSGQDALHADFASVSKGTADRVLEKGSYSYSWGDGWCAAVQVSQPDVIALRKMRRTSKGFCGYGWMITSIIEKGRIST
jgi:hypothetical protein